MQAAAQFSLGLSELSLPLLSHCLSQDREVTLSRLSTRVGEAEEVEGWRFASAISPCGATEADEPGLVGVQFQTELREALAGGGQEGFGLVTVLESHNESSSAGESHPRALTEPAVKLSRSMS